MKNKIIPKIYTSHFSELECEISYQHLVSSTENPTIVILHALTGNSNVTGESGWWNEIVGKQKVINTDKYNILSIDTLGNGFSTNTHELITDIEKITINNIALINLWLLNELQLTNIHTLIGGSLGGAIAWQMWYNKPNLFKQLISVGANPLQDHWIKASTFLQKETLKNNKNGYEQARMWSMLFYRNAIGIDVKFRENAQSIENWLTYHGNSLKKRFDKRSYEIMNHLLGAIGNELTLEQVIETAKTSQTKLVVISIDSDWLFHPTHQQNLVNEIKNVHQNITHHSLESIHGHDAFLIEFEKLKKIVSPYV